MKSEVTSEEAAILWRTAIKAKASAPVLSRTQAMLSLYDPMFEETAEERAGPYEGLKLLRRILLRRMDVLPRPLSLDLLACAMSLLRYVVVLQLSPRR